MRELLFYSLLANVNDLMIFYEIRSVFICFQLAHWFPTTFFRGKLFFNVAEWKKRKSRLVITETRESSANCPFLSCWRVFKTIMRFTRNFWFFNAPKRSRKILFAFNILVIRFCSVSFAVANLYSRFFLACILCCFLFYLQNCRSTKDNF